MGETPQMERQWLEGQERRDREGMEAQNSAAYDAKLQAAMDQAANDVVRNMGLNQSMTKEMIELMASGWAVQHGFSAEAAKVVSAKAVKRVTQPHLYGPLELNMDSPQSGYRVRMSELQQNSREALRSRIISVIGDPVLAARIVQAICEGL